MENNERTRMLSLIHAATEGGVLRKLVLSKPHANDLAPRQNGKLCLRRGERVLVMESVFEGGRVAQKLISTTDLDEVLAPILAEYGQINLITSAGDAELRTSKKGKVTLIGGGLSLRLSGEVSDLARFDIPIDREKKHILQGNEPFLVALGISDKNGRVHDKRQAKFRQINRFLEYLENVYCHLPKSGWLTVFDLCCGKSYLSFAVYHYLHVIRGREVSLLGVDLKRDVIEDCERIASSCDFRGMRFICGDVRQAVPSGAPDLVMSLHACDIATDIVLETAVRLKARVILSTPCCHRYVSHHLACEPLAFAAQHPQLRGKLCEALTDALRILRLESAGYATMATELTDPENTPKNTLLRAVLRPDFDASGKEAAKKRQEYEQVRSFLLGNGTPAYPEEA
ncbi:MAG: SAM-dependent methyltransferase [Clostridia bacterium]|nr:SAM-dependent methyltransferase [Clostridia bacterium]